MKYGNANLKNATLLSAGQPNDACHEEIDGGFAF